MRTRLPLVAVTVALIAYHLLSFGRHGIGLSPYHLDLDVYRIGSLTWWHGGELYGALPRTRAGIGLPFSYPTAAAVLLSPLAVVPMAAAGFALTLASIALTWVVLRVFGRHTAPRWPRGALVGLAAAVKLTPAAFILFFLLRNDRRAAGTAAVSFAVVTGAGFILDWHDSVRYWTGVVFSTSRPGSPAYVGNQAISGVLARAGLDPHSLGGTATWLVLAGAVALAAVTGMRRALAAGEPALALSLNAVAALLISPISWSHHWVWAAPALLCLAVVGQAALVARRGGGRVGGPRAFRGVADVAAAAFRWRPRARLGLVGTAHRGHVRDLRCGRAGAGRAVHPVGLQCCP